MHAKHSACELWLMPYVWFDRLSRVTGAEISNSSPAGAAADASLSSSSACTSAVDPLLALQSVCDTSTFSCGLLAQLTDANPDTALAILLYALKSDCPRIDFTIRRGASSFFGQIRRIVMSRTLVQVGSH